MTAINIDNARILEGNYIGAPRTSCAKIDFPTKERVTVSLGGKEYDRAVYERVVWRNQGENTLVDRFVWVDGKFYSLTDILEHSATFAAENGDFTITESDAEMWAVLVYADEAAALRNDFVEYNYHSEAEAREEWDLDDAEYAEDAWIAPVMSKTVSDEESEYTETKVVDVLQHVYHIILSEKED